MPEGKDSLASSLACEVLSFCGVRLAWDWWAEATLRRRAIVTWRRVGTADLARAVPPYEFVVTSFHVHELMAESASGKPWLAGLARPPAKEEFGTTDEYR